jgi:hypothetical protein
MYGYPDYRGFGVRKLDIHGNRQLSEFVRREVRRYFPAEYDRSHSMVDRLRARLTPGSTILQAHRGSLRVVVAARTPMAAYDRLLDEIDQLTDPRSLRRVDVLN